MESYNFSQDLFDTYQSLSDWMKLAWLVVPPAFLLGLLALVMRYRLASKRGAKAVRGTLAYTILPDENGGLRIYAHDGGSGLAVPTSQPTMLPLPDAAPAALAKPQSRRT